ncbi:MAG: GNAT family N-acetyltransferase [Fusobacteriaceae bacterium]|jgi:ribosomal protein S18 acetylase RimI-like enzyme|nr:GNAT family N-acetyltransferase [Fusobacteriaceae bacterium]
MAEKEENITIRAMVAEDYDAVYALWKRTEGMGLRAIDDSREGIAKFLRKNPETNFVALKAGQLVGVILGSYDGRRGYVYHTAVESELRGQGIGKALVNTLLAKYKEIGATKLGLIVLTNNPEGLKYWQKRGFVLRTDNHYLSYTVDPENI